MARTRSRAAPARAAPPQSRSASTMAHPQQQQATGACEADARAFTKCLDENNGNMQICDWYLQALKACQQAASSY